MFRALLKKQFLELNTFYFYNKKTGKRRTGGSLAGMIILFAFVFSAVFGAFFAVGVMLCDALVGNGNDWLYFAMMGMISIALGTFGSVFNTYSGLYQAKDNDQLLSMPIPPSYILIVRMISVFLMSLLYTALVWIPTVIAYLLFADASALAIVFGILLLFVITAFVTVLTCALGWVVALISSKLKNKSFITVIITLLFLGAYYFVYFKANELLNSLVENSEKVSSVIKTWIYPIYMLGKGATGEAVPMLIFTLITAALFAVLILVLSRSFVKITTTASSAKKKKYKGSEIKTSGFRKALVMRELRHFLASPTYMLNAGLGMIVGPVLAIFAMIKSQALLEAFAHIGEEVPMIVAAIPVFAATAVCVVFGMNVVSAPSVSLEGKNLWIVRSLPVDTKEVLHAKSMLHFILNTAFSVLTVILLTVAIKTDVLTTITMIIYTTVFNMFTAEFGLILNLKKPDLEWTSESVPVKQGMSVMITLFADWGIAFAVGIPFIGFSLFMAPWVYMLIITAIFAGITFILRKWVNGKGVRIFERL